MLYAIFTGIMSQKCSQRFCAFYSFIWDPFNPSIPEVKVQGEVRYESKVTKWGRMITEATGHLFSPAVLSLLAAVETTKMLDLSQKQEIRICSDSDEGDGCVSNVCRCFCWLHPFPSNSGHPARAHPPLGYVEPRVTLPSVWALSTGSPV